MVLVALPGGLSILAQPRFGSRGKESKSTTL
jgi:hypothetical protein